MGDIYVKDEFRRHKEASPQHTIVFLNEWTNYCATLSKQLSSSGIVRGFIGKDLTPEKLDSFADEQLKQLLDLKMEATKVISTGTVLPKGDKHEKETGKTFDPKIPMIR